MDEWTPFVDMGRMYCPYYPPISYSGSRTRYPRAGLLSSPATSEAVPVLRRSYFAPQKRDPRHIPVYARATHPFLQPSVSYAYNRYGVAKAQGLPAEEKESEMELPNLIAQRHHIEVLSGEVQVRERGNIGQGITIELEWLIII